MAQEIQIKVGTTGSGSQVLLNGKPAPVTRVDISLSPYGATRIDLTMGKNDQVGVQTGSEDDVIQGYLVSWEEYRDYMAWRLRNGLDQQ